jgi:hypothetical protein
MVQIYDSKKRQLQVEQLGLPLVPPNLIPPPDTNVKELLAS